jgi:hypothetical protein
MKPRNLLILFFLFAAFSVNAQRFNGGVLVGLNASQIDGDSWAGFYKAGLLAGAFVNTELRDDWSAQLEIKYSAKGAAPHKDHPDYPQKVQLNYIDVPVLAAYEAVENLKLEAGLSVNFLFNSRYFNGTWYEGGELNGEPNSMETSILAGINYRFFYRFDINIRWNYSLFPIRSEYSGSNYGEGALSNHVINFGLYFYIGQRN